MVGQISMNPKQLFTHLWRRATQVFRATDLKKKNQMKKQKKKKKEKKVVLWY